MEPHISKLCRFEGWSHISIFYRRNMLSKTLIPYCSHDCAKTFLHNFCYILRKKSIIIFFRSLTLVSENMPKIISIGPLITEKQSFRKLKTLSILACFISKMKKPDIFNFPSIKCFVKRFLDLKIWNVRVNYCGNYGPSKLLFCFTGNNLEKCYNGQRETAVNSLVYYFES